MSRLISRDPFARTELHSYVIQPKGGTVCSCQNCGQTGRLYQYVTETDDGRKHYHPRLFCSVGCFRSHSS